MSSQAGFNYIDGHLCCDGVPVQEIASEFGTPCYVYSSAVLRRRFERIRNAFSNWDPLVCFSVKCLANLKALKLLADAGSGFDVVSGGELYRVVEAGGDPSKAVYAGVGKTREEIEYALRAGVHMFNVESAGEMHAINSVAREMSKVASVAIRVNPDVDPRTHAKTTTGKKENKFGVSIPATRGLALKTREMEGVRLDGLHVHLGSPIYSADPYVRALKKIQKLRDELQDKGCEIGTVNIGGGYCMSYTGESVVSPIDYARAVNSVLEKLDCRVIIEPGRHIAAPAGILLLRVTYRKERDFGKRFVICDGGMNDLLRPTLYEAYHRVWTADSPNGMPDIMRAEDEQYAGYETEIVDVVGPICESGDYLAKDRPIPRTGEGDILAVFDAGAYGFTMSSNYNAHPRPAEVMVSEGSAHLARRRETYEDLVRLEKENL